MRKNKSVCNTLSNRVLLRKDNSIKREFIELPVFIKRWKELGLDEDDLLRLQEQLLSNPKAGVVIRDSKGIRKLRFAFRNKGKSGSTRVIYVDFEVYEKIFLITAFEKKEKENLSKKEISELKQLVKIIENQLN